MATADDDIAGNRRGAACDGLALDEVAPRDQPAERLPAIAPVGVVLAQQPPLRPRRFGHSGIGQRVRFERDGEPAGSGGGGDVVVAREHERRLSTKDADRFGRRMDVARHGPKLDVAISRGQATHRHARSAPLLLTDKTPAVQNAAGCEIHEEEPLGVRRGVWKGLSQAGKQIQREGGH